MYRKRSYKKRYPRRRRVQKKSSGWMGTAQKALKLARHVAGFVNTEYKHYDINTLPTVVTWSGTIGNLCSPTQGTAINQRTGDSIKLKNLTMRCEFAPNSPALTEIVRLIIFHDKQNTITTGAQLIQSTGNANVVFSPKNDNNQYETKVLYDKSYIIDTDNPIRKMDLVFKLNWHLHFDAGAATIDTGAIKFAAFSQNAAGGALFGYYTRVTYVDN